MLKVVLKAAFSLAALLNFCLVLAQPAIEWSASAQKKGESLYTVNFTGKMPSAWYVYGINKNIEGLESPLISFEYENANVGAVPTFKAAGEKKNDPIFENKTAEIFSNSFEVSCDVKISDAIPQLLKGTITVYSANGNEFYPIEYKFSIPLDGGAAVVDSNTIKRSAIRIDEPVADCGGQATAERSLFGIFLLGFLGGLIALLTPCVFPMVPVTVSYFTMQSATKKAAIKNGILFGLFIFLIYILLSVPFHIL